MIAFKAANSVHLYTYRWFILNMMTLLTMSALIRIVCSASVIIIVVIIWAKTAAHLIVGLQLPALENPHITVMLFNVMVQVILIIVERNKNQELSSGGYKLSCTSFLWQNFATAERHWWSCPQMLSRCWLVVDLHWQNQVQKFISGQGFVVCRVGGGMAGIKKWETKTLMFVGKKETVNCC